MITNTQTGTRIDEIADNLYRISTPVPPAAMPGGFSFNQFLLVDDAPLLFHTGMRSLFPLVSEAIEKVMPVQRLRYLGLSHFEADECGALNLFLAAAPQAEPLCGKIAAMVSVNDFADRPARALASGESLPLGRRSVTWYDAPHLPHNWETGYLFDQATRTLLCGDIFTQGGHQCPPVTESELVGPSEAFRRAGMTNGEPDYHSHGRELRAVLDQLAATRPRTLAVMHGSSWTGRNDDDGAAMLRDLARALADGS